MRFRCDGCGATNDSQTLPCVSCRLTSVPRTVVFKIAPSEKVALQLRVCPNCHSANARHCAQCLLCGAALPAVSEVSMWQFKLERDKQ